MAHKLVAPKGFSFELDDENPGWHIWRPGDETRFIGFIGKILVRKVGEDRALVRMLPERRHTNLLDAVHGGVLLAVADISLFAAAHVLGIENANSTVTLDLSAQFLNLGKTGIPLEAEVELLRQTKRLLFLRGLLRQDGQGVLSYTGTGRRPTSAETGRTA